MHQTWFSSRHQGGETHRFSKLRWGTPGEASREAPNFGPKGNRCSPVPGPGSSAAEEAGKERELQKKKTRQFPGSRHPALGTAVPFAPQHSSLVTAKPPQRAPARANPHWSLKLCPNPAPSLRRPHPHPHPIRQPAGIESKSREAGTPLLQCRHRSSLPWSWPPREPWGSAPRGRCPGPGCGRRWPTLPASRRDYHLRLLTPPSFIVVSLLSFPSFPSLSRISGFIAFVYSPPLVLPNVKLVK